MTRAAGEIVFAWTETGTPARVRVATTRLNDR
jgi:hypothetical protein